MFKLLFQVKRYVLITITAFSGSLHAGSDAFFDLETTLGADDNVTRAAWNKDIENDGFLTVAGTGGYVLMEGPSGMLTGKVLLEANSFFRFSGLSNVVAAGKLNYTFGFSSRFGAPWFAFDLDYGVAEFNSFMRDSNIGRATATMGKQITDATSMRLGFSYKNRDAESSVFDTENASFFINLDWAIVNKHIVYVTYKYQTGDIFSSASDPNPPLWVIDASKAIADDDVFVDKTTYRLDGDIQFFTLGYNLVRDLHSSFDLSARYLESEAKDVNLMYEGLTLRATYFVRFDL